MEMIVTDFRSEISLFLTVWQQAHTQFFVMMYFHIHTNMVNNDQEWSFPQLTQFFRIQVKATCSKPTNADGTGIGIGIQSVTLEWI